MLFVVKNVKIPGQAGGIRKGTHENQMVDRCCGDHLRWRRRIEHRPRGRLADVIVVPRPQKGDDAMVQATLEVALLETGRPVLVVPPNPPEDFGNRVIILWSGAEEAARAVAG